MKYSVATLVLLVCSLITTEAESRPVKSSDATINSIIQAIESGDAQAFSQIDDRLEYIPQDRSQIMLSTEAFEMLRGCHFKSQKLISGDTAFLQFDCPNRAATLKCTTGGLRVMVYDDNNKTEMGLTEEWTFTGDCPVSAVPPIPAAFEPDVARQVARVLIDGINADSASLVADTVQVARSAKYGTGSHEIEFQGRGLPAFVQQAQELTRKLGKPRNVSCDASNSICQYTFRESDRFLLAAIMTRDHKVEFIQFIYSTRSMVQERMQGH